MVFHWSLSDNKSSQVFRTLLSILADFNNAAVWMVSPRPLISSSSSSCINSLLIVPSAPITIGITGAFMFYSFFSSFARSWYYLSFRFLSVLPCGQPGRQSLQFGMFTYFGWQSLSLVAWTRLGDYYHYFTAPEFFTPALTGVFPLESEWQ